MVVEQRESGVWGYFRTTERHRRRGGGGVDDIPKSSAQFMRGLSVTAVIVAVVVAVVVV